jgi:hypothetical protein
LASRSANLEHTASYAACFREAGDEEGARVPEIIGREQIAHVGFADRWFEASVSDLEFDAWRAPPLSPLLMRGRRRESSCAECAVTLAGGPWAYVVSAAALRR